jgi:cytochrome b subunit of formate dehydrogenase
MFDWFREIADEMHGINTDAARLEKLQKKELEKAERYIFSKKSKTWIIALSVLYIIIAGLSIFSIKNFEGTMFIILKNIAMSAIALATIFALLIGGKKGELSALVLIFIFVFCLFLSLTLL